MICSLAEVNRRLTQDPAALIAEAEEAYHSQLSRIADHIAQHSRQCPLVLLSGPSGSGKTTTAHMLEAELDRRGLETHTLSLDNYFCTLTPEEHLLLEQEQLDLESPARVDAPLLKQQLEHIIAGQPVELPVFDFFTHARKDSGITLARKPDEVVILEGIHALNPAVVALPEEQTTRLYVSVRTRIEGQDGTVLHPKYIRLLRRMLRDVRHRGRQVTDTLAMFHSVNRGEDRFIMPYKHRSSFEVDTFFPYEVNVYRRDLLEPLQALGDRPQVAALLPVLAQALPLEAQWVPPTALIREFIGDSIYHH